VSFDLVQGPKGDLAQNIRPLVPAESAVAVKEVTGRTG
jgi:hypothetical protein